MELNTELSTIAQLQDITNCFQRHFFSKTYVNLWLFGHKNDKKIEKKHFFEIKYGFLQKKNLIFVETFKVKSLKKKRNNGH